MKKLEAQERAIALLEEARKEGTLDPSLESRLAELVGGNVRPQVSQVLGNIGEFTEEAKLSTLDQFLHGIRAGGKVPGVHFFRGGEDNSLEATISEEPHLDTIPSWNVKIRLFGERDFHDSIEKGHYLAFPSVADKSIAEVHYGIDIRRTKK